MTATLVRPTTPVHPSATSPIAAALTFVVIAAATIASVGGLAVHRLYTDDTAWATAALRGGDLVTLVLIVPGLIAATLLARRGSVRALLVWGGLLGYGVYNFAFYVFGAAFNDLFLLHVIAFSASVFALIAWATQLDTAAIARRFDVRTPHRAVAVLLIAVAAVFATLWTTFSIIYAATGHLTLGAATLAGMHLVFALDLRDGPEHGRRRDLALAREALGERRRDRALRLRHRLSGEPGRGRRLPDERRGRRRQARRPHRRGRPRGLRRGRGRDASPGSMMDRAPTRTACPQVRPN